jgi:uncharacterized protein (UPF0332 family)
MNEMAQALWARAQEALRAAEHVLDVSPSAAASRAYYSAFYAVSAVFALEGRTFKKHSGVESAVHRDLVRAGVWAKHLGTDYSMLARVRTTCDYDLTRSVSRDEAVKTVRVAARILRAVSQLHPEKFPDLGEG